MQIGLRCPVFNGALPERVFTVFERQRIHTYTCCYCCAEAAARRSPNLLWFRFTRKGIIRPLSNNPFAGERRRPTAGSLCVSLSTLYLWLLVSNAHAYASIRLPFCRCIFQRTTTMSWGAWIIFCTACLLRLPVFKSALCPALFLWEITWNVICDFVEYFSVFVFCEFFFYAERLLT